MSINEKRIVVAKCPNCGAEVTGSTYDPVITCHWCHTVIPAENYSESTVLPDQILPFKITKEIAQSKIESYVEERRQYATTEFLNSYHKDNIVAVYLPYMLVDINAHLVYTGVGEKTVRGYSTYGSTANVSAYNVKKEFDLTMDDVLIKSSNVDTGVGIHSTNYIIDSIGPFDTYNSVKYNPNFLNGYTSDNRKLDVLDLNPLLPGIVNQVGNVEVQKDVSAYDRGVIWNPPKINILGSQWTYTLLPVWLYSFLEKKNDKITIHYIAVNGRTGEINGSIPLSPEVHKRLFRRAALVFASILLISILFYIPFSSSCLID